MARKVTNITNNLAYIPSLGEPNPGRSVRAMQQDLSTYARKNRIIAGTGIRTRQTEHGIIIEATDIHQIISAVPEQTEFLAKVTAKNEDGTYLADLYYNMLNTEPIKKNQPLYTTINAFWDEGLQIGDIVVCYGVEARTAGVKEVDQSLLGEEETTEEV